MSGGTISNQIRTLRFLAGEMSQAELGQKIGVTRQTIRRDLGELCDARLLTRVHGGAMLGSGVANMGYETRAALAGRDEERLAPVLGFLVKHVAHPRHAPMLLDVAERACTHAKK
jgi:predicted ArsR family transcriptional regulator